MKAKKVKRSLFNAGGSIGVRLNKSFLQLIGLPFKKGEKVLVAYEEGKVTITAISKEEEQQI